MNTTPALSKRQSPQSRHYCVQQLLHLRLQRGEGVNGHKVLSHVIIVYSSFLISACNGESRSTAAHLHFENVKVPSHKMIVYYYY